MTTYKTFATAKAVAMTDTQKQEQPMFIMRRTNRSVSKFVVVTMRECAELSRVCYELIQRVNFVR